MDLAFAPCGDWTGAFEVRDFARDADGAVRRAWVIFEYLCDGSDNRVFGEIRVGEPPSAARVQSVPAVMRWPGREFRAPGDARPITVYAVGDEGPEIRSVHVVGPDAADFSLVRDDCLGATIGGAASCQVWVQWQPR